MKLIKLLQAVFILILLAPAFVNANAAIANLEKEIKGIDRAIAQRKQQLSSESVELESQLEESQRSQKSIQKRINRHQKKVERAEEQYRFVGSNISELDEWYNGLGAIEQGLNSGTYETKKATLQGNRSTARSELSALEKEQAEMQTSLDAETKKVTELQKKLKESTSALSKDKKLKRLLKQKDQKSKSLAALITKRKQAQAQAAAPKVPVYKSYVYVISGKKGKGIEKTLKLKDWVQSYDAKYIEANWNDLEAKVNRSSGSMLKFLAQFEQEFKKLPKDSKIILIGYAQGGAAAVLAATEVAHKLGRDIEYLITIDPMGMGDARMNAVYKTEAYCQGRISKEQYVICLDNAKKRVITSNVKNFYNRWQRESVFPIDATDRMVVNKQEKVLATGKFLLESASTGENQKRVYYGDKKAHELILSDAAEELPKILVPHLR